MKKIIYSLLLFFFIHTNLSADKLTGKMFLGWGFTLKTGNYSNNYFLKEYMINNGGNAGISLYYDGLSLNRRNRFGVFIDFIALGNSSSSIYGANVITWLITPYFEHSFFSPGEKKLVPSILIGLSLLYYDIKVKPDYNTFPDSYQYAMHDRHFKLGFMTGTGLSYYFSNTFSLDILIRIIYVPFDNNLINLVSSFGFSTTF